jgi:hypothetical protein
MPQEVPEVAIPYRLPVTVVRFSGTRKVTTNRLHPGPPKVTHTAAAVIEVRADPRTDLTLTIPGDDLSKLKTVIALLDDGRLSSAEAVWDARHDSRWLAAGGLATMFGSVGAVLGGPLGLVAGVAIGGAVGVGATTAVDPGDDDEVMRLVADHRVPMMSALTAIVAAQETKKEDMGVDPRYRAQHEAEAHVLITYRCALANAIRGHADAANEPVGDPEASAERMLALESIIRSIRAQAEGPELLYLVWLQGQLDEVVEQHDFQLYVDQLPTQDQLTVYCSAPAERGKQPWNPVVRKLRIAVTCDIQPESETQPEDTQSAQPDATQAAQPPDNAVAFRRPVMARLTTWRIEEVDGSLELRPIRTKTEWMLVTHPREYHTVVLPSLVKSDSTVNVGFSEAGALTKVTSEVSGYLGERANALAGLPESLKASVEAGSAIGGALTPQAYLKSQADMLELRKKLGLVPPGEDPLKKLKDEVAEAELRARLGLASRLTSDPSALLVTFGLAADG